MKSTQTQDLQRDIFGALTQQFPIRGWEINTTSKISLEHKPFKVYHEPPLKNRGGEIVVEPKYETMYAAAMEIRAVYKIPKRLTFLGMPLEPTPECLEKNVINLYTAQLGLNIEIRADNMAAVIHTEIVPHHPEFQALVETWSKRRYTTPAAKHILAQLALIRENYLRQVRKGLATLGQMITMQRQDCWTIAENIMLGKLSFDQIEKLPGGVLVVTTTEPKLPDLNVKQLSSEETIH